MQKILGGKREKEEEYKVFLDSNVIVF